jgi:PAS domain S-box-containing protein
MAHEQQVSPLSIPALSRWLDEYVEAGVVITDAALVIRSWNQWLQRHTSITAAEAVGRSLFEVLPELSERNIDQYYRDALEGQVRVVSRSLHGHLIACPARVNGEPGLMPQSARILPLIEDEAVVGTITSIVDVTERVETEQALRQQFEASEQARQAAEEASRTKDAFLATLSHELRNPINAIVGWTHLLISRGSSDRAIEVIDRNAGLMMRMVDDMLDVARILTGKLSLAIQPADLAKVLAEAIDVVRPAAAVRQITIEVLPHAAVPLFDGDPVRLQQVFLNLLQNAVKFSPQGGRITLRVSTAGSRVTVAVTDVGQGISADFLPYVFDRFRQGDASATRRHGGLGLGLALVRQLVELHGGTVRALSDGPGRGATFEVTLPLARASERASEMSSLEPALIEKALRGHSVMVVDDNADIRGVVAATLAGYGAQIVEAGSVDEAIRTIRSNDGQLPRAIVADIAMPDQDGYALLGQMRALEGAASRIPIVALTGFVGPDQRSRLLDYGFDAFIAKPFAPDALAAIVAKLSLRAHPAE